MTLIKPEFSKELMKYGAFDFNACYNCGNCTATCSLSTKESSFPREIVRNSILGLEDDIKSSLKPWLCYYCGECTTQCPKEANPGELMMAIRRWLTSQYDWTGLSGLLYKSLPFTITAFILSTLAVILFSFRLDFDSERIMHYGHLFEMTAIATVFALILLPNLFRMWYFIIIKPKQKVTLKTYLTSFSELIIHMFTQKRTLGCDDSYNRWFQHLLLVIGYLALLMTTVFLDWFGSNNNFVILLGYIESITVFTITFLFMKDRINKNKEQNKNSQPSDWLFVLWLFLMGLTAFLVRIFIDTNLLQNNLWLYILHLTILVQWAVIIVPFGKWTHFLYRSFAMYFDSLINIPVKKK